MPKTKSSKIVTGVDVSGWFEEYYETKKRRRPIPTSMQCKPIADYICNSTKNAGNLLFLQADPHWNRVWHFNDIEMQVLKQAVQLLETLKPILEYQKGELLDEQNRSMQEVDDEHCEREEAWIYHIKKSKDEFNRHEALSNSLLNYIGNSSVKKPGRPSTEKWLDRSVQDLQNIIGNSLIEAGWTKVSFFQNGPATTVLAKCLSLITDGNINPQSLRRRLKERR